MNNRRSFLPLLLPATGMIILILDSPTALQGVQDGIDICIKTVIPSLFPFFVLSAMITGAMGSVNLRFLKPLGMLCKIPEGAEGLLIPGFLGGYPVGAQAVKQAYKDGLISRQDAHRLLGFCSNCGPAFLFGVTGTLFEMRASPWFLWGIHVISAIVVARILPGTSHSHCAISKSTPPSLPKALEQAVRSTASVCGWILLSRCLIAFLDKWVLRNFSMEIQAAICGFLELANGCVRIHKIGNEGIRFMLVSGILGFGGLCVGMQTASVTGSLGTGWYFPGKIMQMALSLSISALILPQLYPGTNILWGTAIPLIPASVIFFAKRKKEVAFSKKLVYNV